jgi:transcriptional regulator with XRE-family HTH domain
MKNGAQSTTNPKLELLDELGNREYREAFVEAHAKDTVAFQIRNLRKTNDWEQRDLAEKLGNGKLQPMISRYENPDYGRYSITTLLELAKAFDVALVVRFAPYSELVEWDWQTNSSTLAPRAYSKDKKLSMLRKNARANTAGQLASFPPERKSSPEKNLGKLASNKASSSQQSPKRENLMDSPNTADRKQA